jgi:hypothetical protein
MICYPWYHTKYWYKLNDERSEKSNEMQLRHSCFPVLHRHQNCLFDSIAKEWLFGTDYGICREKFEKRNEQFVRQINETEQFDLR